RLGPNGIVQLAQGAGMSTQSANLEIANGVGSGANSFLRVLNPSDTLVLSGVLSGTNASLTIDGGTSTGGTLRLDNAGNTFQCRITVNGSTSTLDVGAWQTWRRRPSVRPASPSVAAPPGWRTAARPTRP